MPRSRWSRIDSSALSSLKLFADLGTAVLIIFVLYAARDVLIPITLSILLAFLLSPVVNWLQKKGLNNISAVLTTAMGLFFILGVGLYLMGSSIAEFAADYPKYKGEITKKIDTVSDTFDGLGKRFDEFVSSSLATDSDGVEEGTSSESAQKDEKSVQDETPDATPDANDSIQDDPPPKEHADSHSGHGLGINGRIDPSGIPWQNYLGSVGTLFGPIGTAGLVAVFALFMLIYRDDLRDRFVAVVSRGNYVVTTEAIAEASDRISKYISAQFLLNTAYGILFGIGLWIIGLVATPSGSFPNLPFFIVMSALVRFLPYVGPMIGAGLPLLISIAVFPGYTVFLAVLALIVAMELVSNNVVEPWLYGSRTGVSAIGVITAAVFWGWLWGGVGLLLATPLTVCLVVLGRYVPRMRYFATLLSDEEQVPPSLRSYQRLLANDEHKLREALQDQLHKKEPIAFLDEVIVPLAKRILKQPATERPTPNELTERLRTVLEQESFQEQLVPEETSDEEKEEVVDPDAPPTVDNRVVVTAIGSRAPIEDVLLRLFTKLCPGIKWRFVSAGSLPDSSTREIMETNPDAVLILALPPGGIRQTQFWCRTLRQEGYDRDIIVARTAKMARYHDVFVLLRKAGATSLTTSFAQTARRMDAVRPRMPRVAEGTTIQPD